MIRKRRSLSSHRSSKEPIPVSRARSIRPPERRKVVPVREDEGVSALAHPTTDEAKQDLILAHAAARRARGVKPQVRFWLAGGVMVVALVALVGWGVSFTRSIETASLGSDGLIRGVLSRSEVLKQEVVPPPVVRESVLPAYQPPMAVTTSVMMGGVATGTATGTR